MMYRFNIRARTRKDTQGAGDLVRYLQRQGEFAPKVVERDRDVDYMTRVRPDTLDHADLVGEPMIGNLPQFAEGDAGKFFVAAMQHERANGRYALALQIALPRGLTHEQHMLLAQDFAAAMLKDKPYLIVKHEPVRDGQGQPHLHVLMSTRTLDGIERDAAQFFCRYNPEHPERGGAQKDPFWNQRQAPGRLRQGFADLANRYLEISGADERIDPRSLRQQGLERERISWNNKIELDPATCAREQAKAREAWEQRKIHRGMENIWAISREGMVAHVHDWMRTVTPGKALEWSSPEVVLAWLERDAQRLTHERQGYERELYQVGRQRMVLEYRDRGNEVDKHKRFERPLVGNRESKIFHRPGDHNYGDVAPRKQELFWTIAEAEAAGYRAAVNQHYGAGAEQRKEALEHAARERVSRGIGSRSVRSWGTPSPSSSSSQATPGGQSWRGVQPPGRETLPVQTTPPGREHELEDITVPTMDPEKPHGRAVRTRVFDRERESR